MPCQICGNPTQTALTKERNVSCGDYFEGHRIYEANCGEIALLECTDCGFGSFDEMHGWTENMFRERIYNDDYHRCDQPFREERPRKLAAWLGRSLPPCDLVDWGGGAGRLAELLRAMGFYAQSYDPFYGQAQIPQGQSSVVTAFEVVEHVPDQLALFQSLKALCKPEGVIIFSTLLKENHLAQDWWYASPRNGHVSFHTQESLRRIAAQSDLKLVSLSPEIHIAAPSAAALAPTQAWSVIPVNDHPTFMFQGGWSQMIDSTP